MEKKLKGEQQWRADEREWTFFLLKMFSKKWNDGSVSHKLWTMRTQALVHTMKMVAKNAANTFRNHFSPFCVTMFSAPLTVFICSLFSRCFFPYFLFPFPLISYGMASVRCTTHCVIRNGRKSYELKILFAVYENENGTECGLRAETTFYASNAATFLTSMLFIPLSLSLGFCVDVCMNVLFAQFHFVAFEKLKCTQRRLQVTVRAEKEALHILLCRPLEQCVILCRTIALAANTIHCRLSLGRRRIKLEEKNQ